jgi:hypothetical protein
MFENSASFFSLSDDLKSTIPFSPVHNARWEKYSQICPSTGAVDRKE